MRVVVVAVGRVKEAGLREAIDEYLTRARRHVRVDETELADGAGVAAAFAKAIPEGAHVIALEVGGRARSSEDFARHLERVGSRGKGVVALLIGGAEGLPGTVSAQADELLSLGAMTLPHRLARLVLAEQLYRATAIWRGEPYAK